MSIVYALSMLVCLGADPNPTQPALALEKQIAAAVTEALESKGEGFLKLAVVAVADDRTATALEARKTLEVLGDLLEDVTVQSKRQVIDRERFDAACRQLDLTGSLKPSDVVRLRKQIDFDGVVSATWSQRNERQTIRLALLTPERVVWTKTLTAKVGEGIAAVRKAKPAPNGNAARAQADAAANAQQADPGVANLAGPGSIPGIIGSGGFLPIGGGGGGVAAGGSKPSEAARNPTAVGASKPAGQAPREGDATAKKPADATQSSTGGGGAGKSTSSSTSSKSSTANGGQDSGSANNSGTGTNATTPDLNRKVLEFATNNLGQQVGNGECWTLAAESLKQANAQPARGYTFGRELGAGEKPLVGDIMQFTSCRFQDRNFTAIMGLPNHTAIIYAVDGTKLTFIHQNFGSKNVTLLTLDMMTLASGNYTTFRPQPRANGKDG